MLNVIKSDLYRLRKTRSMYVIWLIIAGILLLTTYMTKLDMDSAAESAQDSQIESELDPQEETMEIGLNVDIPTEVGDKITLYDVFYGNISGKAIALFIVIFTVLFTMADYQSGFIKNTGGQIRHRWHLMVSKACALLVFTVLTMIVVLGIQAAANRICFGYLKWGSAKQFGVYVMLQIILHYALALLCMFFAAMIRNNVISMIIAVCLCMNVTTLLYGVIDNAVHKMGQKEFTVLDYTVTGKISMLSMNTTRGEGLGALAVSLVFIIAAIFLSSLMMEKRDIV